MTEPKETSGNGEVPTIGLALSGGGVRAAIFHLGVLRYLADCAVLEQVTHLSTVSGGSLIAGIVLAQNKLAWPGSRAYLDAVYPEVRRLLTTQDLFSFRALGLGGAIHANFRLVTQRGEILAELLKRKWKIEGLLRDLPESPLWWINATCLETGKNWRFSKREMGDWQFGRHYEPPFGIAEAVAASAAVPYAIGALRFKLPNAGWYATDPATRRPLRDIVPPLEEVRLWDGGVYENLGLEPLYKRDRGLLGFGFLICSDASGPLSIGLKRRGLGSLLRGRLATPRLYTISSDQIRALRSRMLVSALKSGEIEGALIRMGNSSRTLDLKTAREAAQRDYDGMLSDEDVAEVAAYPTDLRAVTTASFDGIAQHGFETAARTLAAYSGRYFSGG